MAGDSKEVRAAKRAAKLKLVEAAKPENERLLNREWNDHVVRTVSVMLLRDMGLVKHQVIDIFCLDEVQVCQTKDEAQKYFTPNGIPWTVRDLKRFLEAYALSTSGQIQEELSIWTLSNKLMTLFSVAKFHGNPVDKNVKRNILLWLHTDLKARGLIHDNRKPKVTPLPTDISFLLRSFFQVEFLVPSLTSTRAALNVALALGLMLDCNSRVSELVDTSESVRVESRPTLMKQNERKVFSWKRVELFAFRDENEQGPVRLQARLTFNKLKNSTGITKGTRQKIIPLRLLPLDLAAEDTLRWLIILGLMDGVFLSVCKWADLESVPYSSDGIKIAIKEEFLDIPVLRSMPYNYSKAGANALVPMTGTHFRRELAMLSRHCGLQYKMLPGCLRRASAYILSLHASPEERCARMGHSDSDKTYFAAYRNSTSTIDFQSMRHGIISESVAQMSSVTLDRLQSPPTRVSPEGQLAISQDPGLLANRQEQCDLTDQIITKYGSFDAVHSIDDPLLSKLLQLKSQYAAQEAYLTKKKFQAEWLGHFEHHDRGSIPQEVQEVPEVSTDQMFLLTSQLDEIALKRDKSDEQYHLNIQAIDPALLAEYTEDFLGESGASHLLDDLGGAPSDDTSSMDDVQLEYLAEDFLDRDDVDEIQSRKSRKNKDGFGLRPIGRHSLFDGVTDLLYNQAPDLTDAALSDAFVIIFNHNHTADRFYQNQEPLPGTLDCRFCGEALTPDAASARHAFWCEAQALNRFYFERLQQDQATTPPVEACTQERCDKPGIHCNYNYLPGSNSTKVLSVATRFTTHAKRHHFDRTTSKYICKPHSLTFSAHNDYRIHMMQHHRAPVATVLALNGKDIIPESFNFWCQICQAYIPRTESTEDDHFGPHLLEVNEVMQPFGFAGLEFSHLWLHPAFCPFCLFDKDLPVSVRMHGYDVKEKYMAHVETHVIAHKDGVLRACPASMESGDGVRATCGETTLMTKMQLKEHLVKDHNMMFSLKKPKRAGKAGDEDDHEKVEEVEDGEDGGQRIAKENVRPKKKPTREIAQQPLREKDINQG